MTESDFDRRNRLYPNYRDPAIPTPAQMNQKNIAGRLMAIAFIYWLSKRIDSYFKNKKQK